MKRLTVSLDERDVYRLKARVRNEEASSKSDALRQILDEYEDVHNRCEELHTECEQLRAKRDELRNQLQERGGVDEEVEEKVDALVERTERQDDALRETLEWSRAGLLQRTKWKLFGRPSRNGDADRDDEQMRTSDDGGAGTIESEEGGDTVAPSRTEG